MSENKNMEEEKNKAVSLFQSCSPFFIAMGDSIRQQLILDIAEGDEEGVNVSVLTGKTRLSRPAVSYHLKMLKDCGIISTEKKGTQVFYHLHLDKNFAIIKELVTTLQGLMDAKGKKA